MEARRLGRVLGDMPDHLLVATDDCSCEGYLVPQPDRAGTGPREQAKVSPCLIRPVRVAIHPEVLVPSLLGTLCEEKTFERERQVEPRLEQSRVQVYGCSCSI